MLMQQSRVLDAMVKGKCKREDAGVLLYHFMGTGKTKTALMVAENMAGYAAQIIVYCPEDLKMVWEAEVEKWNFKAVVAKWSIVSYEDVRLEMALGRYPSLERAIAICDEVHKIHCQFPANQRARFLLALSRARVRLFLSGTPARTVREFMNLVHAVSGGGTPSTSVAAFNQRYLRVNLFRKASMLFVSMINRIVLKYWIVLAPLLVRLLGTVGVGKEWKLSDVGVDLPEGSTQESATKLAVCFAAFSTLYAAVDNPTVRGHVQAKYDFALMASDAKRFVSVVSDPATSSDGASFATVSYRRESVIYSDEELELCNRFVQNDLDRETILKLGYQDAELFEYQDVEVDCEAYREVGRHISLVAEKSSKLTRMHQIAKSTRGRKLMVYHDCPGRTEIVCRYLETAGRRCGVVVSGSGGNNDEIRRFNSGESDAIVVENVYEGFSLFGCETVIFLSPPTQALVFSQAVGRARRFGSHDDLPEERRSVDVYTLVNEFPNRELDVRVAGKIFNAAIYTLTVGIIGQRLMTASEKKMHGDFIERHGVQFDANLKAGEGGELTGQVYDHVTNAIGVDKLLLDRDGRPKWKDYKIAQFIPFLDTEGSVPLLKDAARSLLKYVTPGEGRTKRELMNKRSWAQALAPVFFGREDMKFDSVQDRESAKIETEFSLADALGLEALIPSELARKVLPWVLMPFSRPLAGVFQRKDLNAERIKLKDDSTATNLQRAIPESVQRFFSPLGSLLVAVKLLQSIFELDTAPSRFEAFKRLFKRDSLEASARYDKLYSKNAAEHATPDALVAGKISQNSSELSRLFEELAKVDLQSMDGVARTCPACVYSHHPAGDSLLPYCREIGD